MISKEETIRTVFDGLIAQGGCSVNERGHCVYRSPSGRKCAVGQIIPDEEYDKGFEFNSLELGPLRDCVKETGHSIQLLQEMQVVHDEISTHHKLDLECVDLFKKAKEVFLLNNTILAFEVLKSLGCCGLSQLG